MFRRRARLIPDPELRGFDARAEIDVLEPDRMESLIEAPDPPPDGMRRTSETSASWLVHKRRSHWVQTFATVMPIHWIPRPQPINPQHFEDQCRGRGQISSHETPLWIARPRPAEVLLRRR